MFHLAFLALDCQRVSYQVVDGSLSFEDKYLDELNELSPIFSVYITPLSETAWMPIERISFVFSFL